MRVTKRFGVNNPNGIGNQRDAMDPFDVTERVGAQFSELMVRFDAQFVQMGQMTKGMRTDLR